MLIISCYSIKGGVGKTAAAVNLAYLAAAEGRRTLLCDLDPQSSATFYFRIKPKVKGGTRSLLKGGKHLENSIKATDFPGLDLLPAELSYRNLDLLFDELKGSKKRLRKALRGLSTDYEVVFLDCPPNITLLSENIFLASTILLVPVVPTTLSARTLTQLRDFLAKEKAAPPQTRYFFSMVERRKKLHQDLMAALAAEHPHFLATAIPYLADIEKMGIHREPVVHTRPTAASARTYTALWRELGRVGEL